MSNWKEYKLDELVEITSSKRIMRSEYQENGIPFFRSKEIIELNSGNEITTELFISKERFLEIKNKFGTPSYGDILLTSVGTLGVPYFVNYKEEFYFKDGNLTWFRKFNNILRSKYLYYWFSSPVGRKALKEITIGSTQPALTITGLKSLTIHLPTLEEQDYIIEILDHLSSKIHLNTQINQTLEQIAQALFKSWFVDFDPVRAKVQALSDGLSFEQAELAVMQAISGKTPKELTALSQTQPERYAELAETAKAFPCEMVEVDGGEVPKGWEVLNANDVIEFNPKETLKKDTLAYYLDMASLPTQGCSPDLPILRKFTSGTRFRNGDTLFARITPCLENGKTAFIQYLPEGTVAWGSTEYIVMRTKGIIPKPYSYLLARYESFREYAIRSMTGTSGRQRTQLDIIETYKVVSPSDNKLWESFSKIINPIFETINSNTNKNITLYNIRDLLLPKLLNEVI